MDWFSGFWDWAEKSAIGSGVVSGLVVAAIVACLGVLATVAKRSWRNKAWEKVAGLIGWVRSIRITTTHRLQARHEMVISDIEEFRAAMNQLLADRDAVVEQLSHELVEVRGQRNHLASSHPTSIRAKLPLPLPLPRWSVYYDEYADNPDTYVIKNLVPRSIARGVRIDAVLPEQFIFFDEAHWPDMSGDFTDEFRGEPIGSGVNLGVKFSISWFDETDDAQSDVAFVEPIRA